MTEILDKELTPEEIADREAWEAGAHDRAIAEVELLRAQAYAKESDKLKYKWEETLDPADHVAFLAAKTAIRERYPYPEPPKVKK